MNDINLTNFGKKIIVLSVFALGSIFPAIALAQTVSLSPATSNLAQNQNFSLEVRVASVNDLFNPSFSLSYNPSLIQFMSATDGGFLSQNSTPIFMMTSTSTPGTLVYGATRLGQVGGVSGSGVLAIFNFKTLASDGQTGLHFFNNDLMDSNLSPIPTTWQDGSVSISTPDYTAPSIPINFSASAVSTSQINLSWSASTDPSTGSGQASGVTGYRIYRGGSLIATVNTTSYQNTGLNPSTTYTYQVSAIDASNNASGLSTLVSATTLTPLDTSAPSVPANLSATVVSTSQINLSWSASTDNVGVTGYRIYRNSLLIATVNTTSYQNTGLNPATPYSYQVSAIDARLNESTKSTSISARTASLPDTTAPNVPTGLSLVSATTNQINLAWNNSTDLAGASQLVSGIAGYKVYRDSVYMMTVTAPQYYNANLPAGTTYSYQVSAVDVVGNESARTASISASTLIPADTIAPSMPLNLNAFAVSTTQINLSWSASTDPSTGSGQASGVTGYRIYRNGSQIASVNTVSYQNTGLNPSTSYSFQVSAVDGAGNESVKTTVVSATTMTAPDNTAPSVPTNLRLVSATTNQINLAWNSSTDNVGVVGYKVYRDNVYMMTVTAPQYYNAGLPAGTTYSYQVSAVDAVGNESTRTDALSVSTLTVNQADNTAPTAPANLRAVLSAATTINLSWTASTDYAFGVVQENGVAGYRVYRNNLWLANVNSLNYSDSALNKSTSYTYQVASYDWTGNESAKSNTVQIFTAGNDKSKPTPPGYLKRKGGNSTSLEIGWTASTDPSTYLAPASGVVEYKVYRNGSKVATINSLSYNDTNLTPQTGYRYQVSAVDGAGNESLLSSSLTAVTDLPPDTIAPGIPANLRVNYNLFYYPKNVRLYWTGSRDNRSGRIKYYIYRNGTMLASTSAVTYFDKLSEYGIYTYQVKAVDLAGNASNASNSISVNYAPDTTAPNAPSNLRYSYNLFYRPTDVRLYWYGSRDERPGRMSYNIYRNEEWLASTTAKTFYNKLSEYGVYQYQIKAVDAAGNESSGSNTVSINYAPDTIAPKMPTNLRVYQNYSDKSVVRATWYGVRDERPGQVKYNVYRNGEKIMTTTRTSFYEKLTVQGSYQYQISAVDLAVNESDKTDAITIVW